MTESIKKAIENLTAKRELTIAEQYRIMAELRGCQFVLIGHRDLIDKNYNDRIANIDRELDEMRVHLSVLRKEAAND